MIGAVLAAALLVVLGVALYRRHNKPPSTSAPGHIRAHAEPEARISMRVIRRDGTIEEL